LLNLRRHHGPQWKLLSLHELRVDFGMQLEHFLFYCRPLIASLNQACALAGVMHGRASVMA
jgi:hypothetical protein